MASDIFLSYKRPGARIRLHMGAAGTRAWQIPARLVSAHGD